MTDTFTRSIWVSVMMHLSVMMVLFLRAIIIPNEALLVRDAIRVDVVDLPQKGAELPAPSPEPLPAAKTNIAAPKKAEPPKPAPKSPAPEVNLKKTTRSQADALRKLKALEALEKIKGDVSKEKAASAAAARPKLVAGNQISEGNSLTGLKREDYNRYLGDIKAKLYPNWNIPAWMSENELKASVVVLIDEHGYVTKKTLRTSSGNEIFDAKCMEAIEATSPFPEPPERLRGVLATAGIVINFPQQ